MGFGWRVCQCSECNGALVTCSKAYRHSSPFRKRKFVPCGSDEDEASESDGDGDHDVDAPGDVDHDLGADDPAEDQINNSADSGPDDDPIEFEGAGNYNTTYACHFDLQLRLINCLTLPFVFLPFVMSYVLLHLTFCML
jgi:hypothetical protein